MTPPDRPRHTPLELGLSLGVVVVLATVPLWAAAWWSILPFAVVAGGLVGGRWLRWIWAFLAGFGAGALAWGLELALLPGDPRSRLAEVLGAAEGLSGPLFLVLGPILIGLLAGVTALAVAAALRLVLDREPGELPKEVQSAPGAGGAA